ncbi:hypothetical protein [Limnospira maxima]|nr:hypothetical protein [Limnospira maxima]QNH56134.1 MAG: hypothetical protein H2674_17485 [Limnospira indica BM01]
MALAVALGVYNSGASDISISQPLRGDRDNMGRSLTIPPAREISKIKTV